MASQTDKKDEFRKYLEKGRVLSILTKALTDLFEMDAKPEDPVLYLYQKFGDNLKKEAVLDPPSQTQDAQMTDVPPPKPAVPVPTEQPAAPAAQPAQVQQAAQVLANFDQPTLPPAQAATPAAPITNALLPTPAVPVPQPAAVPSPPSAAEPVALQQTVAPPAPTTPLAEPVAVPVQPAVAEPVVVTATPGAPAPATVVPAAPAPAAAGAPAPGAPPVAPNTTATVQ